MKKAKGKAKAPSLPPPEKKSARQLIRDMIDAEGDNAARALGKKLKMKPGTVDAYIKGWARIKGSGGASRRQEPTSAATPTYVRQVFRYCFRSKPKAEAQIKHLQTFCGIKPEAFRIIEGPGGMFGLTVDAKYVKEHGALTKKALSNLKKEGGRVEGGVIYLPTRKKQS